jgi:DNA mismatch endonuclease (patch repair protein)
MSGGSARSRNMSAIKSEDMKPEIMVRRKLHSWGYRYRKHFKGLPGKPDLVFTRKRVVVFVHGCFWHQHDAENCHRTHIPKTNSTYWTSKLARNVQRDKYNIDTLKARGWKVLVVWECQIEKNLENTCRYISENLT